MDTSKEYIKMCYEAHKLQDRDFAYFMTHPKEYVGEYNCEHGSIMTWLPRQDQLQKMITDIKFTKLLFLFNNFSYALDMGYKISPINTFTSMEQLWLVFVMKEEYNKIWNGEKWEEV